MEELQKNFEKFVQEFLIFVAVGLHTKPFLCHWQQSKITKSKNFQTVIGNLLDQNLLETGNIHIFSKESKDENSGLHVRGLNEDASENRSGKVSVDHQIKADAEALQDVIKYKTDLLLIDFAMGQNLKSVGKDVKEIFINPGAAHTMREVATDIKTLMTSEQSLHNIQSLQEQIRFKLLNRGAPKNVKKTVDVAVQFVTNPENLPKVEESGQNVIDLIQFLGPGLKTFKNKKMIESHIRDKNAKHTIEVLWQGVHLLANANPSRTMRDIITKVPGITMKMIGNAVS